MMKQQWEILVEYLQNECDEFEHSIDRTTNEETIRCKYPEDERTFLWHYIPNVEISFRKEK